MYLSRLMTFAKYNTEAEANIGHCKIFFKRENILWLEPKFYLLFPKLRLNKLDKTGYPYFANLARSNLNPIFSTLKVQIW